MPGARGQGTCDAEEPDPAAAATAPKAGGDDPANDQKTAAERRKATARNGGKTGTPAKHVGFIKIGRFVQLMLGGVALISAGFLLEDRLPSIGNVLAHLSSPVAEHEGGTPAPGDIGGRAHPRGGPSTGEPQGAEGPHSLTFGLLCVLLLKELGVACLVAGAVGSLIDKQAREYESRRAEELQFAVAENAVFALFGLSHDVEFVQAVVDTNLKARIVRRDMEMTYSLRSLTAEEAITVNSTAPQDAMKRFLVLDMEQRYSFENVSTAPYDLAIPLGVARRKGAGAREVTGATFVAINGVPLSGEEIAAAIDPVRSTDDYLHYSFRRSLSSQGTDGSTLHVTSSVSGLKEQSDNEVWGSFFPTMGNVRLTMKAREGMNFGVRPLSNGELERVVGAPKENEQEYVLSGPLLRHNSVVFWWRVLADEGGSRSTGSTRDARPELGVPASIAPDRNTSGWWKRRGKRIMELLHGPAPRPGGS